MTKEQVLVAGRISPDPARCFEAQVPAPDPDELMMCPPCFGTGKDTDMADGVFNCGLCKGSGVMTREELERED